MLCAILLEVIQYVINIVLCIATSSNALRLAPYSHATSQRTVSPPNYVLLFNKVIYDCPLLFKGWGYLTGYPQTVMCKSGLTNLHTVFPKFRNSEFQKFRNSTSRNSEIQFPEIQKFNFQKFRNSIFLTATSSYP